jgi:hypothetical protein
VEDAVREAVVGGKVPGESSIYTVTRLFYRLMHGILNQIDMNFWSLRCFLDVVQAFCDPCTQIKQSSAIAVHYSCSVFLGFPFISEQAGV